MQPLSPHSIWRTSTTSTDHPFPPLDRDRDVDVLIIGAGITGLSAALHLRESGRRVLVVEAGTIGSGTTGGTSGHLDCHPDQGFQRLISDFGEESARLAVQARLLAIDRLEAWCRRQRVSCGLARIPAYLYTESDSGLSEIENEYAAARQLDVPAELVPQVPVPFTTAGGVRLLRQGRIHIMEYLANLARFVVGDGDVVICEETRVMEPPEDGEPCTVQTDRGRIRAGAVIAATHSAFFGVSSPDVRVAPYQSYCLAAESPGWLPDALFWDDGSPYHYTRTMSGATNGRGTNQLIIGGEDHKTGQGGDEREHFARLADYASRKFNISRITHQWSAELFEPNDGLPYVGQMPSSRNLYCATGFSGTGLTWGMVAGELLADAVLGRPHPLEELLSPSRVKPLASGLNFVRENVNAAGEFISGYFEGPTVKSLGEVPAGQGRVVTFENKKLAVYRDDSGRLHVHSARCTHAGCVVQWNDAELTWDCPCHGGRFAATGERLYGPPAADLDPGLEKPEHAVAMHRD